MNDIWIKQIIMYKKVKSPKRFQRLNPIAWIQYWRKKKSNPVYVHDISGHILLNSDGSIDIENDESLHLIKTVKME